MSEEVIRDRVLIITPGRTEQHYWRDIWAYRQLFAILAWRDVAVRYKQTVIGIGWAIIRPLVTTLVFTLLFGQLAKLPNETAAPYAIMVFAGVLPWAFFSNALSDASDSVISNSNLIGKVYFPRLIVPTAAVVVALVDFLVSFSILIGLMLWYRFLPGWQFALLPTFVFLVFFASLGPGLWISALNTRYRDFRYVIPFIVQIGLFASPVGFASNIVPQQWRLLYSLNPLVGIIDGFRWCILGGTSIYWPSLFISIAITGIFFWFGLVQFRRMEKSFADLI